jgi:flagellar hook-associated protein FlgK
VSDILSIGGSAVAAYQKALGTVSNNIANLNTVGYSRQELNLSAGPPQPVANIYLGTGVAVDGTRRLYSEFAESALRSSYAALNTQGPMADYANRIIDVIGSSKVGLASTLDQFYASAQSLSGNPSSIDLRSKFLRDADGIAAGFREISGQLITIESDSKAEIQSEIGKLNEYSKQLAVVNVQLHGQKHSASQPPQLLDQRDQLLREMSKLTAIRVNTLENGEVDVSLGNGGGKDGIVQGAEVRPITAVFDVSSPSKVEIVIDPFGQPASVPGMASGSIGGLISFREQALEPTLNQLDSLASTFASAVNGINKEGVDLQGRTGGDLFAIEPMFKVDASVVPKGSPLANGEVVKATIVDNVGFAFHDLQLTYDSGKMLWIAKDMVSGVMAKGADSVVINGTRLEINGGGQDAQMLILRAVQHPSSSITLGQKDAIRVAAAALFRVTPAPLNASDITASITYQALAAQQAGPTALRQVLDNTANDAAGVRFVVPSAPGYLGLTTIPAGTSDAAVYLDNISSAGQNLQILTRDGRHLVGAGLTAELASSLLQEKNGFVAGATYSDSYLNRSGDKGYEGLTVFYGARALAQKVPVYTNSAAPSDHSISGYQTLPARIESARIADARGAPGSVMIAAGAITINGVVLGELVVPQPPSAVLQASDVAAWMNTVSAKSGVTVTASNRIEIAATRIQLANSGVSINGVDITPPVGQSSFASVQGLADAINARQVASGVTASVAADGSLALYAASGADISLAHIASRNDVFDDVALVTYHGSLSLSSASEVRVGMGVGGTVANLSRLGLRTGAYVDGVAQEDLLVYATGAGGASIAATYQANAFDPVETARGQKLEICFTSATDYRITDVATNTEIASRSYDPANGINIGGRNIKLSGAPSAGDRFTIDGNQDGVGNNDNIVRIVDLQKTRVTADGKTIGGAYNDLVGNISNVASQAKIAQQALQVVNQQAEQSRDKVSGVNLDEEAADLVRFQQAYQAAAKTMQIASQLFDYVAQIR